MSQLLIVYFIMNFRNKNYLNISNQSDTKHLYRVVPFDNLYKNNDYNVIWNLYQIKMLLYNQLNS